MNSRSAFRVRVLVPLAVAVVVVVLLATVLDGVVFVVVGAVVLFAGGTFARRAAGAGPRRWP